MINNIEWNVYGKITNIAKSVNGLSQVGAIDYKYDPSGNRIGKIIWMYNHPGYNARLNWYVRDAQGNVMAVYQSHYKPDWTLDSLTLIEHHMYGSSRLGIINRNHNMDSLKAAPVAASLVGNTYLYQTQRGHKLFELSNHLGNVLVTISDRKNGVDSTADGNIDYYTADVVNANDYYPFGMLMPERKYSASDAYRYGFNGKENDNEVKGEGNQQDYGMRVYDPRIAKFLSVDPITGSFPWYTPYQFAGNNPIPNIDLDGKEPETIISKQGRLAKPMVKLISSALDYDKVMLENQIFEWSDDKKYFNNDDLSNIKVATTFRGGKTLINKYMRNKFFGNSNEMFWLNTISHEMVHADQYKKNAFLTQPEEHYEIPAENLGQSIESYIIANDNKNLFDKRWSEVEREGYAEYLGLGYKLQGLNNLLTAAEKLLGDANKQLEIEKDDFKRKKLFEIVDVSSKSKAHLVEEINATTKKREEVKEKNKKLLKQTTYERLIFHSHYYWHWINKMLIKES